MCIGIIGGGISGIVAAVAAKNAGHEYRIFEREKKFGGSWFFRSYPDAQLQTQKRHYQFADYPWPESAPAFPNEEMVRSYIDAYVGKHQLTAHTSFETTIEDFRWDPSQRLWHFTGTKQGESFTFACHALVVATGLLGVPQDMRVKIGNADAFCGDYIDPQSFSIARGGTKNDYAICSGKDVAIVGNGPTGCDLATIIVQHNPRSLHIFYRRSRWIIPRRGSWFVGYFFLNRLFMRFSRLLPTWVAIMGTHLIYWPPYIVTLLLNQAMPRLFPPFEYVDRHNIVVARRDFFKGIHRGLFSYIKVSSMRASKDGHHLTVTVKGRKKNIPIDMIINCTGYKTQLPWKNTQSKDRIKGGIINENYPRTAFVGFLASFHWISVSEEQSKWFMQYLKREDHIWDLGREYTTTFTTEDQSSELKKQGFPDEVDYFMKSFDYIRDLQER